MARIADALNAEWPGKPATLSFRDEIPADRDCAMALYRSVREPELALTDWDETMRCAFVAQQFDVARQVAAHGLMPILTWRLECMNTFQSSPLRKCSE